MKCFRTDLYKWLLSSYVTEEFLSQEYVYKFFTYRSVETYDLSVLFFRVVKPWKQRYYVPSKRLYLHRSPRCVTNQNIIIEFFTHVTLTSRFQSMMCAEAEAGVCCRTLFSGRICPTSVYFRCLCAAWEYINCLFIGLPKQEIFER